MKIKVIDLFKLMLERKAPKKIRVLGIDMTFIETAEWGDYKDDNCFRLSEFRLIDFLNEDVEIIEENKKIEKLNLPSFEEFETMNVAEQYVATAKEYDVLNELIDEVNKLKGDDNNGNNYK